MVALLDIDDISAAIGREPVDQAEEDQWQFYIDSISSFINGYVDVSFEEIDDDTIRYQADYYGRVNLGGDRISTVTSVVDAESQVEAVWHWNQLDEILRLDPNQVVDVTYTHGYAVVPEDITFVATQGVLGMLGLGATGNLTSYTVGDVTEVYSDPNKSGFTVVTLQQSVLNKYRVTKGTWRLGYQDSAPSNLPTL